MKFPRSSGILLHPTSLPGHFGIGDLGDEAYRFADFLADSGQSLWQMLPLGPTHLGHSPYQCLSVFAGNPLLISLERLVKERHLRGSDLKKIPSFPELTVDYDAVEESKLSLLRMAFESFEEGAATAERSQFDAFCEQQAGWLDEYAFFMAVKEAHNFASWNTWEEDIRKRQPKAVAHWKRKVSQDIRYYKYQQYHFFKQWAELKTYCNERGIRLIGDISIFVALDSAEVWSHPEMFYLDASDRPTVVAGVPPDYFSKTGQLWGNPLYRWDVMAKDDYAWWVERLRVRRALVDILRLDHFRGFEKYWEVPATDTTAINGRWVPGPGVELFEAIQKALGALPIIAEDLGTITPEVEALRDQLGFPGMRVLQFAFGDSRGDRFHLPHNYPRNCIVYTGTHDNNTIVGWYKGDGTGETAELGERERARQLALKYLGIAGHEINWDFVRLALMSVADMAIIPLQDVMGLGSEARMNTPGTTTGNWRWRFTSEMLTDDMKSRLRELTVIYGRAAAQNVRAK